MDSEIADLVGKVKHIEDFEECADALCELGQREPAVAARLALDILSAKAGDVHLRAFAFGIFYARDLSGAFQYIRQNADSCEPHVFGSMLDAVTDGVGLMGELKELPEMVQFLLSVIRLRGKSELHVADKYIKAFLRVYGLEESAVRAPEKKR